MSNVCGVINTIGNIVDVGDAADFFDFPHGREFFGENDFIYWGASFVEGGEGCENCLVSGFIEGFGADFAFDTGGYGLLATFKDTAG